MKKAIYRASVDSTVVGFFESENAAKKALGKKTIIEIGGSKYSQGWVDRIEEDGSTTSLMQRILAGGDVGWFRND